MGSSKVDKPPEDQSNSTADTSNGAPDAGHSADSSLTVGQPSPELKLDSIPHIFIIDSNMDDEKLHELEEVLLDHGAPLTYDLSEARLFLTSMNQPRRAKMELRSRGVLTEQILAAVSYTDADTKAVPAKRPRSQSPQSDKSNARKSPEDMLKDKKTIHVVKYAWLDDIVQKHTILPLSGYVVYSGSRIKEPKDTAAPPAKKVSTAKDILARAAADNNSQSERIGGSKGPSTQRAEAARIRAQLLHEETTDTDDSRPTPEWVKQGIKYSCQRRTPVSSPNTPFASALKQIREARELIADEIGVRAYSTAIAAVMAYPYPLQHPREVLALPGCNSKVAALFAEYSNGGSRPSALAAIRDLDKDARLKGLRALHSIWGVGPAKAREFYQNGWRDLDDVVEFGWRSLTRVQQVGAKYHDELALRVPRAEIETVADVVAAHARSVLPAGCAPEGVRACLVGGYRRGDADSGDADVLVSHRADPRATIGLVKEIVGALQQSGYITHTLTTQLGGTKRGQTARGSDHGGAFDALDKALVVWQDPRFDAAKHPTGNPNPHRRVDIIVAPWSRVGCAVLGWTGATTFERDLRRYAEKVRGWRFDSSGIRDLATGEIVEVETRDGRCCESMEEAERVVFEALGLEYLEPWERCTG